MLIDWFKFIPALLLLLTPIALFHGKHVRYRGVTRDWHGYWVQTFVLWTHLADFARAMLGAWWMAEALQRSPDAQGWIRYSPYLVQVGVFMLATTVQAFVCKETDSANAPFAFVVGLVVGFFPPFSPGLTPFLFTGLAVFLAVVFTMGVHTPTAFFPVLAVTVLGVGILFTKKKLLFPLGVTACAVALPCLLVLLFPRDLVVSFRAKRLVGPPKKI